MDQSKEVLALYDTLIENHPGIERKGKSTPYTSINGHMFSFLTKDGVMGLRLSEDDRDAFIEKYDGKLMEQHGRIMKEYVEISQDLLQRTSLLSSYLQKSLEYVTQLKPKATKKKK